MQGDQVLALAHSLYAIKKADQTVCTGTDKDGKDIALDESDLCKFENAILKPVVVNLSKNHRILISHNNDYSHSYFEFREKRGYLWYNLFTDTNPNEFFKKVSQVNLES